MTNLKANFIQNLNLRLGAYEQALRDFEYITKRVDDHALAYRQAAYAAQHLGNIEQAGTYFEKEKLILSNNESEFHDWYRKLSIESPLVTLLIVRKGLLNTD